MSTINFIPTINSFLGNIGFKEMIDQLFFVNTDENYNIETFTQPVYNDLIAELEGAPQQQPIRYFIIENDEQNALFDEYIHHLHKTVNNIRSVRIFYRRPLNISNIKYTFIKTQLTIKTFVSLLLTAVKFQLFELIEQTLGNIDSTYLGYMNLLLSKFFIHHNTELLYNERQIKETEPKMMFPTTSKIPFDNLIVILKQYIGYTSRYINGSKCGVNSLTRIYLPYDLSRKKFQRFLDALTMNQIIRFQFRTNPYQELYDIYFLTYLYENQYYEIYCNDKGKIYMRFHLETDNEGPFDFSTTSIPIYQNQITQYERELAQLKNNIMNEDDLSRIKYNNDAYIEYYNLSSSIARNKAIIQVIRSIQSRTRPPSNTVNVVNAIPEKFYDIEVDSFPSKKDIGDIRRVLTDKSKFLPRQQPGVTPSNLYYEQFQQNKYKIIFILIQNFKYYIFIDFEEYRQTFKVVMPLSYKDVIITQNTYRKIPIQLKYISPFNNVNSDYISIDYMFYNNTESSMICDTYPYTTLGLIQNDNQENNYFNKLLQLSQVDFQKKCSLENLVLFQSFIKEEYIDRYWFHLNGLYRVATQPPNPPLPPRMNDEIYRYKYITYTQPSTNSLNEETYLEEKRIVVKRRVISLVLYFLKHLYKIKVKLEQNDIDREKLNAQNRLYYDEILALKNIFNQILTDLEYYNEIKDISELNRFVDNLVAKLDDIFTVQIHLVVGLRIDFFDNLMNGYYFFLIYHFYSTYMPFQQQVTDVDITSDAYSSSDMINAQDVSIFTGALTRQIIEQRLIRWITGLIYLSDNPPLPQQILVMINKQLISVSLNQTIEIKYPFETYVNMNNMIEYISDNTYVWLSTLYKSVWIKMSDSITSRPIYFRVYNSQNTTFVNNTADTEINGYSEQKYNTNNIQEIDIENNDNKKLYLSEDFFQRLSTYYNEFIAVPILVPSTNRDLVDIFNQSTTKIVQLNDPLYDYSDEILRIFYSIVSDMIYVGGDSYFRCYIQIKPKEAYPTENIMGWRWDLPFLMKEEEIVHLYKELVMEAVAISKNIFKSRIYTYYLKNIDDLLRNPNIVNEKIDRFNRWFDNCVNNLQKRKKTNQIYTIAKLLKYALQHTDDINDNARTRDDFLLPEKDLYSPEDYRDNTNGYITKLEDMHTVNIDNIEVRTIYKETINLNHQRIHRENVHMNQDLIHQIIVIARKKLKNLGYINDVHFIIDGVDILLPYPFKYINSPTNRVKEEYKNYIVNGVSDEVDFIEEYVLNASANDIIVNDSNVCVELSKIMNDTQLTSEISAFPQNEIMDNGELNAQIRESIQKKI